MLATFETGVRYHMFHALGLFAVAWAATRWPGGATTAAGWLFVAGTLIFSGSLYLLAITGGMESVQLRLIAGTMSRCRPVWNVSSMI